MQTKKLGIKRQELYNIYKILSNDEKRSWASKANYTSYVGLYRYLTTNGDNVAYDRVVRGLHDTIGKDRFDSLVNQVISNTSSTSSNSTSNINTNTDDKDALKRVVETIKDNLIPVLLENSNKTQLEQLRQLRDVLGLSHKITSNILDNLEYIEQLDGLGSKI